MKGITLILLSLQDIEVRTPKAYTLNPVRV